MHLTLQARSSQNQSQKDGGEVNYRGQVTFAKTAQVLFPTSNVIRSSWMSYPNPIRSHSTRSTTVKSLEHEAKVSKISEEQLYYLMSRGLTEAEATEMIVMGFVEPFTKRTTNGIRSRTQPIDQL